MSIAEVPELRESGQDHENRGNLEKKTETAFSIEELREWKTQIESLVRDHPVLSAGIAVGAGVLIARLIRSATSDDGDRKRRHRSRGGLLSSEIGRAIMGSLATMAAAKVQELMMEHAVEEAEEPEPPPRRARKKASPRPSQQRRRRPPVEE
jgi:hypothetical protein